MIAQARRQVYQPLARAVMKLLGDEHGLVPFPVLRGPARGIVLNIDLQRKIELAYVLGSYEPDQVRRFVDLCRPGWTVWDIGTYLGFYTVLFGRLVGPLGRVVAFEPDPRNMLRTQKNAERNGIGNVLYMPVAVAAGEGSAEFILSDNTNSHLPGYYIGGGRDDYSLRERNDRCISVSTVSLDDALDTAGILSPPNLVKLDIEGAEIVALQHASRLFGEVRPILVLELHNPECDAAAWAFSQRFDYHLERVADGHAITAEEQVRGTLLCTPQS